MTMNYWFTTQQLEEIKSLYLSGLSAQEIKDKLGIPHTTRSIQRRLSQMGVIRTVADSFRLAVKKGRVTYHRNPNKLTRHRLPLGVRAEVLERDGFKCSRCGASAKETRLEVDHKDNDKNNNNLDNLWTLCEECNKGKYLLSLPKPQYPGKLCPKHHVSPMGHGWHS